MQTKIPVMIEMQAFETAIGLINKKTEVLELTLDLAHKLKALSSQSFATDHDEAVKIEDIYEKGLHKDTRFQALGLRNLVRREAGLFKFVLPYICK